ncbi:RNA polymerase sigma factor [Lentibacter algarum]|uniref:RNA polymerase sigma factor n=1 Tax=Lentibacter algarum TaxID=576131 RepID=UPI001C0A5DED|nr:RNA polymerase sigma factor [Lentibacter algarum]MBU2982921.1 RNA polymerase sigma factor [Lentibacter algarum]
MSMAFDDTTELSDAALLTLFANGDKEASAVLTRRLVPVVLAHAFRLLGVRAEAEDVAQEAMLRLWKIAPEWRQGEAKVTTWLYRVTANLCTDKLRKRRSVPLESVAEPLDESASVPEQMQDKARMQALDDALAQLPDRQRQAVVLRHIEEMQNPQIAEIMEISVEAVESLTARGKRALTKALGMRQDELGYSDE